MAYYGGDGGCFSLGDFAGQIKRMFINGAALELVPPVKPAGVGSLTRGVEIESANDLDERQIASWMKQLASVPGAGEKRR